jgi:hypothetical protein
MWKLARSLELEEKLKSLGKFAVQGEIVGEGIQNNPLKIKGHKFYAFNLYDIEKGKFLDFEDFICKITDLEIPRVYCVDNNFILPNTVEELVNCAIRKSIANNDVWAEGLVFRPLKEMRDEDLGRLSFKAINPEFLLKYE